jgi:cystathionine beta-lyase
MKYNFDAQMDRRGTHSIKWDFLKEAYGTNELIPFTIADSDFAVAPEIVSALIERINRPAYGYTNWNQEEFSTRIADWFARRFATTVDPRAIVYGPNVMYIIKTLIELLVKDRTGRRCGVILQNPAYDGFIKMLRALGHPVAVWDFSADRGDWSDLRALCAADEHAILLLSHPHNPTGTELAPSELESMLRICQQHDIFVISDEIHMDLVYKPLSHTPVLKVAQQLGMAQDVALVSSASKTFNISGLQGGYMILESETLRRNYIRQLRDVDGLYGASIMGLTALMAGYERGEEWLEAMKEYVSRTIDWIEHFIAVEKLPISFQRPDATYIIWLDVSGFGLSEDRLIEQLIARGIVLSRGSQYLLSDGVYVRINIATRRANVMQAFYTLRDINNEIKQG